MPKPARALLLWLVAASPAFAATEVSFRYKVHDLIEVDSSGRALIDGDKARVVYETPDPQRPFDTLLYSGDQPVTALSSTQRTYFTLRGDLGRLGAATEVLAPMPGRVPPPEDPKVKVDVTEEGASEELVGLPTKKTVIRISYELKQDFGAETVRFRSTVTALVWSTGGLDVRLPPALRIRLNTSGEGAAAKLDAALSAIAGVPLKQVLSVTRVYSGGQPATTLTTIEVTGIKPAEAKPEDFQVPPGWRFKEPEFSRPGIGR